MGQGGKMKISFWSHVRGLAGVTTNLTCISALVAIGRMGKTVILENHYSTNSIGDLILVPEQIAYLHEHGEYYSRYGMEYILKRLYSGEKGEKLIHGGSIPLLFSSMLYIPQGKIVNREVFEYEFNLVQEELFQALEHLADYVFVDTEANQNLSSNVILKEADMVVVNLDQDIMHLRGFFNNYASMLDKAVYLIGNYQSEAEWDVSRICKEFHIPRERIGIIPFNMEMADSMAQGRLLQFLNRNYYKASDSENEYLLRYAKKASQMIRKNAMRIRREEREAEGRHLAHVV